MIYPTLPALISLRGIILSLRIPISSASYSLPVFTNRTLSPLRMVPFTTLKYAIIPRKELNTESKTRHCSGASGSPTGAGTVLMIASNTSVTPSPVLAEQRSISSRLQPNKSIISSSTRSGIAESISHLLSTGIISRSFSMAMYRLLIVCACTPCVASTTSTAPSHAAMERLTS